METKELVNPSIKELEKAFDGDLDLMLFYLTWVKLGRNATKAYQELNPHVEYASAAVLGSRMLKRVKIDAVLKAYDLTEETYYTQLVDGIKAERRDQFTGEMYPDHKTREPYHTKLGKILGIETDEGVTINADKVIAILGGASNVSNHNGHTKNPQTE